MRLCGRNSLATLVMLIAAGAIGCNAAGKPSGSTSPAAGAGSGGSTGGTTGGTTGGSAGTTTGGTSAGTTGGTTSGGTAGTNGLKVTAGAQFATAQGASGPNGVVAHTATLLDDGRVLICGGIVPNTNPQNGSASVGFYLLDPTGQTLTDSMASATSAQALQAAVMSNPNGGSMVVNPGPPPQTVPFAIVMRYGHAAILLPNGKVLVTGGLGSDHVDASGNPVQGVLNSAHLFDPASNTFTMVPATMVSARAFHAMDLLPNGTVLITGGISDGSQNSTVPSVTAAEIYDPSNNTFTAAGTAPHGLCWAAHAGVATGVVLWGGLEYAQQPGANGAAPTWGFGVPMGSNGQSLDIAQTYVSGSWAVSLNNSSGQYYNLQPGFCLVGGKLFMAGGQEISNSGNGQAALGVGADALLADTGGSPTAAGSLSTARWAAAAAEINTGDVIVVGGDVPNPNSTSTAPLAPTFVPTAEYWSATSNGFIATVNMIQPRVGAICVRLKNGMVAAIGGSTGGTDDMLGWDGNPTPQIEIYSK
jgi:hypothetical protein